MFLRFTSRTNADGAVVRYVALAHNRRVDGRVKPDVLMSLGRVDQLDVAGLRRLAASIGKHFGVEQPAGAAPAEVVDVRTVGTTWLLDGVWRRLDVGAAVRAAVGARRFSTGLERVLFALVAHRAVVPPGGPPAAEWVREEAVVPGLSTMDDGRVRRVLDLLADAGTLARVQESLLPAVAERSGPLFVHTVRAECDDGEHVVIGLALTRDGIPVRCWGRPAGAGDDTVAAAVRDDLLRRHPGPVVTVVERAFSGADDLAGLRRDGGHYIAGMRMRAGDRLVEAALSRPGRHRSVRGDLRVREIRLDSQDARFVVCRDPAQARAEAGAGYLIATSDPHLSAEDVALGYLHLRNGRDPGTRPLPGPAARAHVPVWWLALLLTRIAEHASGRTWPAIDRQLRRVAQVTLAGPGGTVTQTTPLRPEQAAIYQALSVQPPARVTASAPGPRAARGRSR
nr:hypothetical protein GCM10020063_055180 [Dactylosporangium thailandense]